MKASEVRTEEKYLLVVPVVERPLGHLEVGTADALGQLVEQGHHHLDQGQGMEFILVSQGARAPDPESQVSGQWTKGLRRSGNSKDGRSDLLELGGLDDVEDLLQLVEEHDLLGAVHLGPVPGPGVSRCQQN